jgi:mRNA-degrading endonuclease RelE of RelBE toxin-antitoxin system
MSYKVAAIENFRKEAKRLIKKYPSLQRELFQLGAQLSENPTLGTPLGNSCYKIRLSIASKGRGKSGGARVISCIFVSQTTVFLLSIYDKSEKASITNDDLTELLKSIE